MIHLINFNLHTVSQKVVHCGMQSTFRVTLQPLSAILNLVSQSPSSREDTAATPSVFFFQIDYVHGYTHIAANLKEGPGAEFLSQLASSGNLKPLAAASQLWQIHSKRRLREEKKNAEEPPLVFLFFGGGHKVYIK